MGSQSWLEHLSLAGPIFDVCCGQCERFHVDSQPECEAVARVLGIELSFPATAVQKVDVRKRQPGDDLSELIELSPTCPLIIRSGSEHHRLEAGQVGKVVDEFAASARDWTFFAVQDPTDGYLYLRFNG